MSMMMAEFSGWLSLYIEPAIYWKMFLMGMAVYALVALLQFFRISKIPMETAPEKYRIEKSK